MYHGVGGNNAVWTGVCLDHLELYCPHATTHEENVAFVDGSVGLQEVGLQVYLKQVSTKETTI